MASTWTNRFTETWVSLIRWSQSNGFGSFQRISPATTPTYALTTSNGVLVIRADNLTARWNGLELRLGFAPQMIDNRPFVHRLDLQKNILPLINSTIVSDKTNRVIVIDPGHGGGDAGTRSIFDHRYEKEFTLDWARRLEKLLVTNGWRVVLTRTNDREVALTNRVAVAERENADLFLSLHFNSSYPDREQTGLETYCLTPVGMPSSLRRGFEDDSTRAFVNNAYDAQNLQLAVRLHRMLLKVNGSMDRGVRRARFLTVLRGQNRPAVLLEGGYLSNPKEARLIADPAHRQRLAEAVAKALMPPTEIRVEKLVNGNATKTNESSASDRPPTEPKNEQ
ncbi:MAG: N-acetylmuramoyl-L-alanine amidase [Verrucomicrobia bacterium]|nr:N-acetylmuramoyl-L-alanine amidase [Verrucomicrobiota bacterium]